MYLRHIPDRLQQGLSKATWSYPGHAAVYLTFDDGPTDRTEQLLDLLEAQDATATFFLLGKRVEQYPDLLDRMRFSGHQVGNHGYAHLNGWTSSYSEYMKNLLQGAEVTGSSLFRPPYGRMSPRQWKQFPVDHRIVMWSIMPGDFDTSISDAKCISRVERHVQDGSIIVLHDNPECISRVLRILPTLIDGIRKKGLRLEALPFIS